MNLSLDNSVVTGYSSNSQMARLLTENWVKNNIYCPSCSNSELASFANNNPVGDFWCVSCNAEYELKSQRDRFSEKIVDGAYSSMLRRISSKNNPHFFFLNYSLQHLMVQNFLVIPKYYFVKNIIEERKPLSQTARRAGWIGCNILLRNIPATGKIYFVRDGQTESKSSVISNWKKTNFLSDQKVESRGWTIEILKLIEKIGKSEFTLDEIYYFEPELQRRFPKNNFVKDKIRQQLQVLRDKGILKFMGNGHYQII